MPSPAAVTSNTSRNEPLLFEASRLTTKSVVVFSDRAEVCKGVDARLKKGANEILVRNLSRSILAESIRVEGRGGAVITEVKFQAKQATKDEDVKEKEKEFQESCKRLENERRDVEQTLARLKAQKGVLEGLAKQMSVAGDNDENGCVPDAAGFLLKDGDSLEKLEKFLSYYQTTADKIDESSNDSEKRFEAINEEISVLQDKFYSGCQNRRCHFLREVTIFVNAPEACQVTLDLFYIVTHASWTPSYDIRVQVAEESMNISYFGLIQQDTDENWDNVRLSLSTALPRVGGQVPELRTTKIGFYKPPQPVLYAASANRQKKSIGWSAKSSRGDRAIRSVEDVCLDSEPMAHVVATIKDNVTSTTFEIDTPTSIPSDNATHKVTIGVVDLEPKFEYTAVPAKSPYAYLTARVRHAGRQPLLAGPAAIFVGRNFVANGSLKAVNPAEPFAVSLGVDPAVKVDYRPARKFHEEYGLLSRASLLTHEQRIDLHNTKQAPVRITVAEPLPQSTDEKLKVTLMEPILNKNDKASCVTKVNKFNNVEWTLTLGPNEKRELVLKYQIEHPKGEILEYGDEA